MELFLTGILPMILMFGFVYIILILPERKRNKKYTEMLADLKVNDEIVTRGGLVGKIISIDGEHMVVQSGPDRTRVKMIRNAISQKLTKED